MITLRRSGISAGGIPRSMIKVDGMIARSERAERIAGFTGSPGPSFSIFLRCPTRSLSLFDVDTSRYSNIVEALLPAVTFALQHTEKRVERSHLEPILPRHDSRDLVHMCQIVCRPGRQQLR